MRKIIIILLVASVNIGFAQEYSEYYYKRKASFENEPNTKDQIIFLGNSITEGGKRGISGDVTDGILFRLDEVTESNPKKIFLLIGTNDMARGKSIEYVLENTAKIILQIKKIT